MNRDEFYQDIIEYLESTGAQSAADVDGSTNLWDCGLVDSVRMVDLVCHIEDLGFEVDIEAHSPDVFLCLASIYETFVEKNDA